MYSTAVLVRLYRKSAFLKIFSKNNQVSNFMNIRPVGAELLRADRWAGRETKGGSRLVLTVAFRKFVNALKIPRSAHIAVLMCFVWISEQTAIISLCKIK